MRVRVRVRVWVWVRVKVRVRVSLRVRVPTCTTASQAYRRPVARLATNQVRARRGRPAALGWLVDHVVMHVLARARHGRAIVDVLVVGATTTVLQRQRGVELGELACRLAGGGRLCMAAPAELLLGKLHLCPPRRCGLAAQRHARDDLVRLRVRVRARVRGRVRVRVRVRARVRARVRVRGYEVRVRVRVRVRIRARVRC